jgi:putative addiction module component (TIGR02574 family)
MSKQAVLEAALQLPEHERQELAERLYESLHGESANEKLEYETEWTETIDRRMQEIREGRAKLVNWEDTMARARAIVEDAAAKEAATQMAVATKR